MSLFLYLIVPAGQRRRVLGRLAPGGEHFPAQRAQGEPRPDLLDQSCRGAGACTLEGLRSLMLYRFMSLEGPFKDGMRIATLPRQVLLGVVEFILVERHLRVGKV